MGNKYDLEERTYLFAKNCRLMCRDLKKSLNNIEDGKQLIKSSGSIAANYIEANEKLGDKDVMFRLIIARKEAKESVLWLRLLRDMNEKDVDKLSLLLNEAIEIKKILSAIINKN